MTKRKFTPPTEFPAEYVDGEGRKVVILGRAPVEAYTLIGYILHAEGGSAETDCWTEKGSMFTIEEASEGDLHDIPREPIVRWMVVGGLFEGHCYSTEMDAKRALLAEGLKVVKMVEEME
jgi:hypothetical protein